MRALFLSLFSLTLLQSSCVSWRCGDDQECREDAEVYSSLPPEQRRFCKAAKARGEFRTFSQCAWFLFDPADYACRESKADDAVHKECVWAFKNPAEAKCKREAKEEDYWECVRVTKEDEDRNKDRDLKREIHADEMREASKRTHCTTSRGFGGSLQTVCH